ncbi:MAG: hypothetical protein AAF447_07740 [Myxococcota bacterium]
MRDAADVEGEGTGARASGPELPVAPEGTRLEELRRALRAALEAGDAPAALGHARELRALAPSDREALTLLETHHRAAGDARGLRDVLVDAARQGSVNARLGRLREAAALSEGPLDDSAVALACWQSVKALDPTAEDAGRAVPRLLEAEERWLELAHHLEREALASTEPVERADVLLRQARLARGPLDDDDQAIAAYRARLELLPGDGPAFDELLALLLLRGRSQAAIALIERRRPRLRGEAGVALLRQLAEAQEQLGELDAARKSVRRILALAAGPSVRRDALRQLCRLDEAVGDVKALADTLSQLAALQEGPGRATTLRRLGDLARASGGDPALAAERYREALDLDPSSEPLLDALCASYADAERFEDLVDLLEAHAERAGAGEAAPLFRRIARLLDARAPRRAAEAWKRVLIAAEDPEALEALADHAARRGDDAAHARWLTRLCDALRAGPDTQRADALRRLADVAAARGDEGGGRRALGELLALAPNDLETMERLEKLEAMAGNHTRRGELLETRLSRTRGREERRRLALALADLHRDVRSDRHAEARALRRALADHPGDDALASRLAAALGGAGDAGAQLAVLDARAEAAFTRFDTRTAAAHVRAAAEVAFAGLGDVEGAWQRLAPLVLGDRDALAQLRDLAYAAGRQASYGDLRVQHARGMEGPAAAEAWEEAAEAYEAAADPPRAFEAMLRAYALDLEDERRLGEVDRLGRALGAHGRLAQVYERLLRDHALDPAWERAVTLRLVGVLEAAGGAREALRHCLRAAELAPPEPWLVKRIAGLAMAGDRVAQALSALEAQARADESPARLEALRRVVEATSQSEELQEALGRLFEATLDRSMAERLLRTRATLLAETLARPAAAAPLFARLAALTGAPEDREAELAALTAAGDHDARAALLARLAQASRGEARVAWLRALARTWDEDLDNRWEAIDAWKRVLSAEPGDAEATAALARLAGS